MRQRLSTRSVNFLQYDDITIRLNGSFGHTCEVRCFAWPSGFK